GGQRTGTVEIQEPLSDDAIRRPSKMDRAALPGAQHGGAGAFQRGEGVRRARGGRPLADNDGSRPGPGVKPGRVGRLASVVRRESGWDHKLADLEPDEQIRECVVMILAGVASILNCL